jgi:hypothetical protein
LEGVTFSGLGRTEVGVAKRVGLSAVAQLFNKQIKAKNKLN